MNFNHDDMKREIRSTRRLSRGFMAATLLLQATLVGALIWAAAVLIMHFVG